MEPNQDFLADEVRKMKTETGPRGAKDRIVETLRQPPRRKAGRYLPLGLAAAGLSVVVFAVFLFTPISASATIARVAKAFRHVDHYRVLSYQSEGGKRLLRGVTTFEESTRHLTLYDESGKELPDDLARTLYNSVQDAKKTKSQNPDEKPGNTKIAVGQFVGGKMIGTAMMQGIVYVGPSPGAKYVIFAGTTSVDELQHFLAMTDQWTVQRGVRYRGRILDRCRLNRDADFEMYVDPQTDLPAYVRIQWCEDEFVYLEH